MANTKKRAKRVNDASYFREKNKLIWEKLTAEQIVNYLQTHSGEKQCELTRNFVKAICYAHSDSNPSLHIVPVKGFVKCYACGHYDSDPIRVLERYTGRDKLTVVRDLEAALNIKILTKAESKELEELYKHTRMKNVLFTLCSSVLVEAFNARLSYDGDDAAFEANHEYGYILPCIRYLEQRKIDVAHVDTLPVAVYPKELHLKKEAELLMRREKDMLDQSMLQDMLNYIKATQIKFNIGQLLFAYHATPKDIANFRIRVFAEDAPDKPKVFNQIADDYEPKLGIFGLGMYAELTKDNADEGIGYTTRAVVVEGEFDAMHYVSAARRNGCPDLIILAHGGGANHELMNLRKFGIREIFYLPDADNGGDLNCKEILSTNYGIMQQMRDQNPDRMIKFKIFTWPHEILSSRKTKTDLDEALLCYGFSIVRKAIHSWDTSWMKPEAWAAGRIAHVIKTERIDTTEASEVSRAILTHASCVREHQDFIAKQMLFYGFSEERAKATAVAFEAAQSEETSFAAKLEQKLHDTFKFIAINRDLATQPLTAWNKSHKYMIDIRTGSEAHIKAALAAAFGKAIEWVRQEVGIPEFVRCGVTAKGEPYEKTLLQQEDAVVSYLIFALKQIVRDVPSLGSMEIRRNGNHWVRTSTGMLMFAVNGRNVIKISYDVAGEPEFEMMDVPAYENNLFKGGDQTWTEHLKIEELQKPQSMTIAQRLHMLADIIRTGWSFHNQDTEPYGLAAFAVMSAAWNIFNLNPQFLASNERSSGKSTLYGELFGGAKNSELHLVEHSFFVDNATPAGVRQSMDRSTLILILDEFDNRAESKAKREKQEEILGALRSAYAGKGVTYHGTTGGESRKFVADFPVMVAGIDPQMGEASQSRFFTTDLKSGVVNHKSPHELIFSKFTLKQFETLRRSITVDIYRDIPNLLRCKNEVTKYCQEHPELFGGDTMQRYKDTLVHLMTPMAAAGFDWKKWCVDICNAKRPKIDSMTKSTSNADLFSMCLYTPWIKTTTGTETTRRTVASYLRTAFTKGDAKELIDAGCGCYLYNLEHEKEDYLLVVWQEAVAGVLTGKKSANNNTYTLESIAARHPLACSKQKAAELRARIPGCPDFVETLPHTFFDVTAMVDSALLRAGIARQYGIKEENDAVNNILNHDPKTQKT